MNQEIARLEELLARVQRNAARPRTVAAPLPLSVAPAPAAVAAPSVAPAAAKPASLAPAATLAPTSAAPAAVAPASVAPVAAASAPVTVVPPATAAAPASVVPAPASVAPAPVARAAVSSLPPALPTAPALDSDVSALAARPPSAPLDASVDELLLEDPFPSVPPAPLPPPTDELDEPVMPLVAVTSSQSAAHDDDVSGVTVVTEFAEAVPEELLEDDIVDLTVSEEGTALVASDPLDELNFDDSELAGDPRPALEEPPASSSRNRIAGTMDEALAHAAEQIQLEEGRVVPLNTPPPESGPQAAVPLPAGIRSPSPPDLDDLLEADILPAAGVNAAVPTTEQLGETIDLDDARGPVLELDQPSAFAAPRPLHDEPADELEVTLPGREFAGGYQDDLLPPDEARHDLDAHQRRLSEEVAAALPAPEALDDFPLESEPPNGDFAAVAAPSNVTNMDSHSASVSTVTVDAPLHAEFSPELLARPERAPSAVAKYIRSELPRPNTFLELLDSSLSLGRD